MKKEIALENQFIPGVAVGEDTIWALTMLNSSKDYRMGMLYENGIIIFKMIIVC